MHDPAPRALIDDTLVVNNCCLAVFVDDTGHEDLPNAHPVYGLGGCAVLGRDIEQVIRGPWKEIRKRVTGKRWRW